MCLSFQFIIIATLCTIPAVCVSFIVSASSCCVHCILRTVAVDSDTFVSSLHLEYCIWCWYT